MESLTQAFCGLNPSYSILPLFGSSVAHSQDPRHQHNSVNLLSSQRLSRHTLLAQPSIHETSKISGHNTVRSIQTPKVKEKNAFQTIVSDSAATGYAAALVDISQRHNMLFDINRDMQKLSRLLTNKDMQMFVMDGSIEDVRKKSVLNSIAHVEGFNHLTKLFMNLLADKKQLGIVKDVIGEFRKLFEEVTGMHSVYVTSAQKLGEDKVDRIRREMEQVMSMGRKVEVKCNVDPSVKCNVDPSLGRGFIIRFGNNGERAIDLSSKGLADRKTRYHKIST